MDSAAVILAAGKGTRMPASDLPKVMHELHQPKIRLVWHLPKVALRQRLLQRNSGEL